MWLDLQRRGRQILMEIPAQDSIPGASYVRPTATFPHAGAGCAAQRAGTGRGCVRQPQRPLANNLTRVHSHRAAPSLSFRDGRWAHAAAELFFRPNEGGFPRAKIEKALERSTDGRVVPAAFDSRRTGELCGYADGQGSRESELHDFTRIAGVLRAAMRPQNDGHFKAVP